MTAMLAQDALGAHGSTVEAVETIVAVMAAEVARVRVALGKIAANAQRQTGSLREIAGSAQHAAREAGDTMAVVAQARAQARNAERQTAAVAAQVGDLAGGVSRLSDLTQEAMEQVAALVNLTERLDEVVDFVRDVSERTNLLSLNASIEAARAGAHGRGFTVVATEIRRLAESTRAATREMEGLLSGVRARALSSGEITRRTGDAVATNRTASEAARAGLATIDGAVADVLGAFERVEGAIGAHVAQSEEYQRTAEEVLETSHSHYNEAAQSVLSINSLQYHTTAVSATMTPPRWTRDRAFRVVTLLDAASLPGQTLLRFRENVVRRTGGRVRVEVETSYKSRGLGQFQTLIDLRMGEVALSAVTSSVVGNVLRQAQTLELPFLFDSRDHANALFDGPFGRGLLAQARDLGLVGLGYVENGFRHLSNDVRPVATPEDLAGLRMRIVESPIYLFFAECLRMTPEPIGIDQLYDALRAKRVDGQDNPVANVHAMRLYEAQRYLTLTAHCYSAQIVLANAAIFDQLGEFRDDVVAALDEAIAWQRRYAAELDRDVVERLRRKIAVRVLTPPERERFVKAVEPVYQRVEFLLGRETLAAVRAAANAARLG
jgi:tripartite ATP-independent transporter DctP family solute receptor